MLEIKTFSYFGGEGDENLRVSGEVIPFESLPLMARAVAACGSGRSFKVLAPVRSTHLTEPTIHEITLSATKKVKTSKTRAGHFEVIRVAAEGFQEPVWFDVEVAAPHRLIAFAGGGVEGVLKHVEKRAYWDTSNRSGFHTAGEAP